MTLPRARRVAAGPPIEWTASALARLAAIDDGDIASAAGAWRRHAPAEFRALLDARAVD